MKIQNKSALLISILIPLAVGSISSLFSQAAAAYTELNQPPFAPPSIVFPVVWTILYILMGISFYMIYMSQNPGRVQALKIYALQLFFNFWWSILFFTFSKYLLAFFWLIALIILIVAMIKQFYKISPAAAYLQIPYLLWCLFAAYLNLGFYLVNR